MGRITPMKAIQCCFVIAAIMFAASCTTTAKRDDLVFIRISNQSGVDFTSVALGTRIIKANSYSNTDYTTNFKSINVSEVTEYQSTRGGHNGLKFVRVHSKIPGQKRRQLKIEMRGISELKKWSPVMQEFLRVNGGVKSTFKNPYTGRDVSGYTLPPGRYTYLFTPVSEDSV